MVIFLPNCIKLQCFLFYKAFTASKQHTLASFPRKLEGLINLRGTYHHPSRSEESYGMQFIPVKWVVFPRKTTNQSLPYKLVDRTVICFKTIVKSAELLVIYTGFDVELNSHNPVTEAGRYIQYALYNKWLFICTKSRSRGSKCKWHKNFRSLMMLLFLKRNSETNISHSFLTERGFESDPENGTFVR